VLLLQVGVVGLGGLGHMAVKFGVAFGCEVYVISRNKNKEDMAKKLGAKAIIPSGDEEEMKKAAGVLVSLLFTRVDPVHARTPSHWVSGVGSSRAGGCYGNCLARHAIRTFWTAGTKAWKLCQCSMTVQHAQRRCSDNRYILQAPWFSFIDIRGPFKPF
jgi:NADPH:quinone reductase-like Zn-dependent oxidoreductase